MMLLKQTTDITDIAACLKGSKATVSFHHNEILIRITAAKSKQEAAKRCLMKPL